MDLRAMLERAAGVPSENYSDLTAEQVLELDAIRASVAEDAEGIEIMGRETGHPDFMTVAATLRAASLGLSQTLAIIKMERRDQPSREPQIGN